MSELHEKLNIRPISRETLGKLDFYDGPAIVVYTDLGTPMKLKLKKGVILRDNNGWIWIWIPTSRFADLYYLGEKIMQSRGDLQDGVFLLCTGEPGWMNVGSYSDTLKHRTDGYSMTAMWDTNILIDMIRDADALDRLCRKNDYFKALRV